MYNRAIEKVSPHAVNVGLMSHRSKPVSKHHYTPEERITAFWNKVNKDGSIPAHMPHLGKCWEWIAGTSSAGYGKITYMNRDTSSHRISWEITYGDIPDGLWVLHKCDNPKCVRPDHLFLGTFRDNIDDMVAKGRTLKGENNNAPNGEKSPKAKLTDEQVDQIRERYAQGGISHPTLAKQYGVNASHITRIINYQVRKAKTK